MCGFALTAAAHFYLEAMAMKTVTFCGYESLQHCNYESIRKKLYDVIDNLIRQGATEFLLSGSGEFDRMCSIAVRFFKMKYPFVVSVLVTSIPVRSFDKDLYDKNISPVIYKIQNKSDVIRRNEYMARHADVVVTCLGHPSGKEARMLTYAKKLQKTVIDIEE